jgi:hypothetical protein
MSQFHLYGFRNRCCSFSTDQEDRANFWSPFAAGHLPLVLARRVDNWVSMDDERLIVSILLAISRIVSTVVVNSCDADLRC